MNQPHVKNCGVDFFLLHFILWGLKECLLGWQVDGL